jgi:hypothetical protein
MTTMHQALWFGGAAAAPSFTPATVSFDGGASGTVEEILEYYNGGSGGSLGISFPVGMYRRVRPPGPVANISNVTNNPSNYGFVIIGTDTSNANNLIANVSAGFSTRLAVCWAGESAITVEVYSGLNATGTLLASSTDSIYPGLSVLEDGAFSYWDIFVVTFAGLAKSVKIIGNVNQVVIDSITFGDTNYVFPHIPSCSDVTTPSGQITFTSDGRIMQAGAAWNQFPAWCTKFGTAGIGDNYWIRGTLITGSVVTGTVDQWLSLSTDRIWNGTGAIKIEIASDAAGAQILAASNNELLLYGTSLQHIQFA